MSNPDFTSPNVKSATAAPSSASFIAHVTALIGAARSKPQWQRVAVSVGFVVAALLIRVTLLADLGHRPTYVPFHAAVILAAVFGGPVGCLTAAALSILLAHTLFFPITDTSDVAVLVTFLATAILLTTLIESITLTRDRLIAAERERDHDARLRLFIEQAPIAIAMFDRDMRYMAASRRWLSDYQIRTPDITGRSHYDVFPNLPPHLREAHRRALAGETVKSEEDELVLADGQTRYERWEVLPWRLQDGSVGGITIFTENITARVAAERGLRDSKAYLKRAQSVSRVGNWRMIFADNTLQGSAQTFELLGQPPGARLDYEMLLTLVHSDDRDRVDAVRKSALQGNSYDIEYRFIAEGGSGWMRERCEPEFDDAGKLVGGFGVIQDITDRRTIEHNLRRSEESLRLALDAAGLAIWDVDLTDNSNIWNDQTYRMLGYEPGAVTPSYELWLEHVHPDDRTMVMSRYSASLAAGTEVTHEHRVIDRSGQLRWISVRGRVAVDTEGRSVRSYGVMADITTRKHAEERDRLLSLEVNHRAKNLLAVVQSVAIQTGRLYGSPDFVAIFNQRIRSLAASHDLLVNSEWQGVEMTELAAAQLAHYADLMDHRIHVTGPAVLLKAEAAQAIGLALHELVTNASKYGALSTADGTVDIGWELAEGASGRRFLMHWKERNGPPVEPPERLGFGHSVLVGMAEYALSGRVTLTYPAEGLRWELDAPAEFVCAFHADATN